ncbi:MAG: hypothetical protein KDB02_08570 [Acidimicrobiales bacterium]|nr:hypothetical protein [Acidimicrobiales bacterium]
MVSDLGGDLLSDNLRVSTTEDGDSPFDSPMGRDLKRMLAIRDYARAFLLGNLSFGLLLDGLDVWSEFEQISDRWQAEYEPHLKVLLAAFDRVDRERAPLPTRDDAEVADAVSAIIALISRLLGDDLPLALPTRATVRGGIEAGAPVWNSQVSDQN